MEEQIYVYWYECLHNEKSIRVIISSAWSSIDRAQKDAQSNNDETPLEWSGFWDGVMDARGRADGMDILHHISRILPVDEKEP